MVDSEIIYSSNIARKPALSIVLCSRNDHYQGNSLWRLETSLNYLAQNISKLGRAEDVEVIVSDWGSQIPLREVIKLSPTAATIVSFLWIPPEIAQVEQKDSPFAEVLAINAAVRRAKGEYIGRIDQDTLVGQYFLEKFFWLYEKQRMIVPLNKSIMLSNRRGIPYRFASRCPPFWMVNRYLNRNSNTLRLMDPPPPHLPFYVYIGILLFHRDLWNICGGYDEQFIYMDFMEIDIILRLAMKFSFVDIGEIVDFNFFHLDHYNPQKPLRFGRKRKNNPLRTFENPPPRMNPNNENWGLNQYPLTILPYPVGTQIGGRDTPPWIGFEWLIYLKTLLVSQIQMVVDKIIIRTGFPTETVKLRIISFWLFFIAPITWKRRVRVFRDTTSGQPFFRWPKLLLSRWAKRGLSSPDK
jgi:hypothetical protein